MLIDSDDDDSDDDSQQPPIQKPINNVNQHHLKQISQSQPKQLGLGLSTTTNTHPEQIRQDQPKVPIEQISGQDVYNPPPKNIIPLINLNFYTIN